MSLVALGTNFEFVGGFTDGLWVFSDVRRLVFKFLPPFSSDEPKFEETETIYEKARDWIIDDEAVSWTDDGYYTHCLPCDRGFEVTDSVLDGPQSMAFREAQNLLHARKALMALTMA